MATVEGKRMIPVYVDEAIYREIKVYSAETDKTIQEIVKIPTESFIQACLSLVAQIKEMKRQAELERIRQAEIQKLVDEHPLVVPGHEVNPLESEVEQPIPA